MKLVLFAALALVSSSAVCSAAGGIDWPGFRGYGGRGIATGYETAQAWDATDATDQAILWRTEIPGLGHSSPTVFGDKLFLTTAVSDDGDVELQVGRGGNTAAAEDKGSQTWLVLCYDKRTGEELWRKEARTGKPRATRHPKATHANATVAADEKHVVACLGSEGCYCYDHDGNLLWNRDLGVIDISKYGIGWGYASSPAIHDDRVVLVCDDPKHPFLVALRLSDGEEVWRRSRQGDCERSWGTALIHSSEDFTQVVVNGWPWIVSYDLQTGDEIWRIEGGGDNPTPTPFAIDDRIYITNSHGGQSPIYAIGSDARGNLSESESASSKGVIWKVDRGGSYMSTPVVWGDYLYLGNTNGIVRCFHAVTGEKVYEERLGGDASITSSLVAADGKIYCPSEDANIYVLQSGPEFRILSKNNMGQPCFATPAVSAGVLFVRTTGTLFAIQKIDRLQDEQATTPPARPNILFIAVDDLRPSLGCYVDAQIGRLIRTLDEEGLRDNTIVDLWSDHGWKPGEHRGWGKMTNYEIDSRVPLLISSPKMKTAGQKTAHPAELLDLYPTS